MEVMTIDHDKALYIGVDVHRHTHTAVVANRFEEELGFLTFTNTVEGVTRFLGWLKEIGEGNIPRIIGIEGSNGHGRLLRQMVVPLYPESYEINPTYTRQRRDYGTKGDKSDVLDAKLMIEVLTRKLAELPKISNQDQSETLVSLEQLISFHSDLTRQTTRLKNQLHQLFHQEKPDYQEKISFGAKGLLFWQRLAGRNGQDVSLEVLTQRLVIKEKISQFQKLKKTRQKVDERIKPLLLKTNNNLLTMPGVGVITAAKILANTKGVSRFKNINQFVKYAGIAPVERQSGKTKKHKQFKGGNRQLNTALYTIAVTQLHCHPKAKEYFRKKVSEGKTKKHALRCLMKRVACIVYGMLRSGERYRG